MMFIKASDKGVALLIVMGVIIVVMILSGTILAIISSQATQSHHRLERTQAYYAAYAGMALAYDKVRTNDWAYVGTHTLCSSGCDITDASILYTVDITITGGPSDWVIVSRSTYSPL